VRRVALVAAAAWAACGPAAPERLPRIVSVSPTGAGVAPDAVVAAVTFSDPVDPDGAADGRFLALAREADRKAVAAAAAEPGGIGPGVPVVPVRIALFEGGRRVEMRPVLPLDPLAAHAIVVGTGIRSAAGRPVLDPDGRRRTFVAAFETGPVPDRSPPLPRWLLPPHGPAPRNLRALRVGFGEPVSGALSTPGVASRPLADLPGALGLEIDGLLPPGPLPLSLESVRDAAGNAPAPLEPLPIGSCVDLSPPAVLEETAAVEAGEVSIAVSAEASEMARLGLEATALPGGAPCGALPAYPASAIAWGEVRPCPGHDPCAPGVRCPVAASLEGICPGRELLLRLHAEDLAGNRSAPGPWRRARTAPGVPRPVLTEVLVDAATPEAGGEFAEVANLGTAESDLAGFALAKQTASGAWSRCALEPLGGPIPPGGHALVAGGAYDGRYDLPPGTVLYRCGATALLGGLANDRPPALALEAPGGGRVSSLGVEAAAPDCASRSVERIHPSGPDAAPNLACARSSPGTPGACNDVTPRAECPRKPW
jgi:hypothetical protein